MLKRTEVRWMCGTSLREEKTSVQLRYNMGKEAICGVLKRNRLRWFGHVEMKEKEDWVRKCMHMEAESARERPHCMR